MTFLFHFCIKMPPSPLLFPYLPISFFSTKYCTLQMTKSENIRCFAFSETWRHLGIAQTSLALLSVCTSFPCEDLLSGIFFLLFSICLFPVCSFCRFRLFNITVYQLLTKIWQDLKKKIMIVICACIFLIAATNVLPLFFGITNNSFGYGTGNETRHKKGFTWSPK